MRQIFAIALVAFSAAAIASGQEQGAARDPKSIVEQVIRELDNERIQAQIHAEVAALERIYADVQKRLLVALAVRHRGCPYRHA